MRPRRVLIIGSGPIVIGQAAEFDYAGVQACLALRGEGVETVLVNSNPATVMTDPDVGGTVVIGPLTVDHLERVIAEHPDALLPTLGGQTGLNLAVGLDDAGVLDRYGVAVLGTPLAAVRAAEDRGGFGTSSSPSESRFPSRRSWSRSRPAWRSSRARRPGRGPAGLHPRRWGRWLRVWRGGRGRDPAGLGGQPHRPGARRAQLLGWQEIEFEVIRDAADTAIAICGMENLDPMGVHTGDSIVVAPIQTLPDVVVQRLRRSALGIARALKLEGGCNVQLAVSPTGRLPGDRGQPPRLALIRPGLEGDRLPDCPGRRPRGAREAAGRDAQPGHRRGIGRLRAGRGLRGRQAAALAVRQVPTRRAGASGSR